MRYVDRAERPISGIFSTMSFYNVLRSFLDRERQGRTKTHARDATRPHSFGYADDRSVRVVTYNVHTCVGVDRRYDPGRIAAVLREIDADIACLQEVDARRGTGRHADQWAYLGEATGCRVVLGSGA